MKTTGSERAAAYLFRSCSGAFIRFRAREQHSPKNERLALKPVDGESASHAIPQFRDARTCLSKEQQDGYAIISLIRV